MFLIRAFIKLQEICLLIMNDCFNWLLYKCISIARECYSFTSISVAMCHLSTTWVYISHLCDGFCCPSYCHKFRPAGEVLQLLTVQVCSADSKRGVSSKWVTISDQYLIVSLSTFTPGKYCFSFKARNILTCYH